jgi:hypothetical protein
MIKLEYPQYQPQVRVRESRQEIFDSLRRKWLVLTPEEWVRQYFLGYLVDVLLYPPELVAVEKMFRVNGLKKRFDAVVYRRDMQPGLLVECKQMDAALSEPVIGQILQYNVTLKADYLVVTNGRNCLGFDIRNGNVVPLLQMPDRKVLFGAE